MQNRDGGPVMVALGDSFGTGRVWSVGSGGGFNLRPVGQGNRRQHLAVVYSAADFGLTEVIAASWTPLSAYAFMVMTLIYVPCVATIAAIRKETNSWCWTGLAVGYSLVLGWLVAVLVYQVGSLFGLS